MHCAVFADSASQVREGRGCELWWVSLRLTLLPCALPYLIVVTARAAFLICEEDKTNEISLRYWFRVVDLDGDGVITPMEMYHFYREQMERMADLCYELVPFDDVLTQMYVRAHTISPCQCSRTGTETHLRAAQAAGHTSGIPQRLASCLPPPASAAVVQNSCLLASMWVMC